MLQEKEATRIACSDGNFIFVAFQGEVKYINVIKRHSWSLHAGMSSCCIAHQIIAWKGISVDESNDEVTSASAILSVATIVSRARKRWVRHSGRRNESWHSLLTSWRRRREIMSLHLSMAYAPASIDEMLAMAYRNACRSYHWQRARCSRENVILLCAQATTSKLSTPMQ